MRNYIILSIALAVIFVISIGVIPNSNAFIFPVLLDGVDDVSFTPNSIPLNSQVIMISSPLDGNIIKLLTENNKIFTFEK